MTKLAGIIVGIIAVIALIVGFVAYQKTPEQIVGSQGPAGERGLQGPAGEQGERGSTGATGARGFAGSGGTTQVISSPSPTSPVLGSVTGPDFYGPYQGVNGLNTWTTRQVLGRGVSDGSNGLGLGTTTPCSIRSPLTATSSLVATSISITTGTSSIALFTLATSTTAYASTTAYGQFTLTSGKTGAFYYVSSTTSSNSDRLFAPGTYLNWTVEGAVNVGATPRSGFILGGQCQAQFITL